MRMSVEYTWGPPGGYGTRTFEIADDATQEEIERSARRVVPHGILKIVSIEKTEAVTV